MAELDLRNIGYVFESAHLDLEIFRLVTVVAASEKLTEMADSQMNGAKWEWIREGEFAEICRILVSIAAIVRNNIDSESNFSESDSFKVARPVGILVADMIYPDKIEPLNLREACNKILHATRTNPDVKDLSRGTKSALTPKVYLYGEYRGKQWRAIIELFEFAVAVMDFV